jgi:CheY-like chemotaxis protein
VDDNPESNRYEIMLLTSLGAQVITSTSTQDAVERLRTGSWDLVLSDMSRDGRGDEGLRLLAWMLARDDAVPLVFYVMTRETGRDRPLGSVGITKQPDELIHLVFDVLERRRS